MVSNLSLELRKKLAKSLALQEVFAFFTETEQVQMQQLNRRFYNTFVPGLITKVKLYDIGNMASGVIVFPGQNYVNVLDPKDQINSWKKLKVKIDTTAQEILNVAKEFADLSDDEDSEWDDMIDKKLQKMKQKHALASEEEMDRLTELIRIRYDKKLEGEADEMNDQEFQDQLMQQVEEKEAEREKKQEELRAKKKRAPNTGIKWAMWPKIVQVNA